MIMTAEGPKLVDWVSAMRGPAELGPEVADNPERPRATNCRGAIRICSAGRDVSRGANGGNGAVFAHRPHFRRSRQRSAFDAGAADPAHWIIHTMFGLPRDVRVSP